MPLEELRGDGRLIGDPNAATGGPTGVQAMSLVAKAVVSIKRLDSPAALVLFGRGVPHSKVLLQCLEPGTRTPERHVAVWPYEVLGCHSDPEPRKGVAPLVDQIAFGCMSA